MTQLAPITQTINSRELAAMVEKDHRHLVRDIEKYCEYLTKHSAENVENGAQPKVGLSDFFVKSRYKDSSGKYNKCFNVTKKGCEFIAHKMTGQKGAVFTAKYINLFHEMEQKLQKPQLPAPVQLAIQEPIPVYTHNGMKVVTATDFFRVVGRAKSCFQTNLRAWAQEGIAGPVIEGAELERFKRANKIYSPAAKIMLLNHVAVEHFKAAYPQYDYSMVPNLGDERSPAEVKLEQNGQMLISEAKDALKLAKLMELAESFEITVGTMPLGDVPVLTTSRQGGSVVLVSDKLSLKDKLRYLAEGMAYRLLWHGNVSSDKAQAQAPIIAEKLLNLA